MKLTVDSLREVVDSEFTKLSKLQGILAKYGDSIDELYDSVESASDYFALLSLVSAQQKNKYIEHYICNLLSLDLVSATENRGDAKDSNGSYFELKISTDNCDHLLNIRQIRLYQDVDYYVCAYIDAWDMSKSWCFKLTKDEMKQEVENYGTFAHGVKDITQDNLYQEYSITISSKRAKVWREKYWDDNLYHKLCKK